MLEPKEGLLTFRAEGNNLAGSRYYSRKLHWPGISSRCNTFGSGVTIGRGYDMKHRTKSEVISHLTLAGVPIDAAKKIAEGAGKSFCTASDFVKNNKESVIELTEYQQLRLFENTYSEYLTDSIRFYNKYKGQDCALWGNLHQALKDVFVDMKYQGRLGRDMVPLFGKNDKKTIISLIQKSTKLMSDENARQRVFYLKENMK